MRGFEESVQHVPVPDDGVQAWVCELCGSVVVVDKVNPSGGGVPYLPSRR